MSDIHARTTAEVDIRNLSDLVPVIGRASIIFQHGDKLEVVQLLAPRDQVVVGRTSPADVCVDIASLSRQHARFSFARGELLVEDLGSRNGTWVGSERVTTRKLLSGDQVRMGELGAVVAVSRPRAERAEGKLPADGIVEGALVVNAAMQQLYQTVRRAAQNDLPVLILGETGTGKELVARALHALGNRSGQRLGVVNCGAIPENLTESILFGHEKGAFTGADRRSRGLFEQSHRGTVFLDEICEMPLATQSTLLRVLESKRVCRLGGSEEIEVDVRVVAATHCDPEQMVSDGTFRQDLLFRLNALSLPIPPLRERVDEIRLLAEYFLEQACGEWGRSVRAIEPEALERLLGYAWPGNIRQLRNTIERGVLLCEGEALRVQDLPAAVAGWEGSAADGKASPTASGGPLSAALSPGSAEGENGQGAVSFKGRMDAHEESIIADAVRRTAGNQRAAARLLRIPYRTLIRKVKKYGLKLEPEEKSEG